MRVDRVRLEAVADILQHRLQEALEQPGRRVRFVLRTSPSDGVQVFLTYRPDGRLVLAIRRPGGKEDPREIQALAQHMGLEIREGPMEMAGRVPRPRVGPRKYLVAFCEPGRTG
ncbi:hypothetical protein TTHN1_01574 [Thermus thermophilus]|uniref:Uncharacterized protein n=1 Tax=Thermus thermophilus TaxID=274 RepID=A0A3P4ATQ4_THETH|nr:hypothetical protein [Thermus thermophilus]VCU53788.1 hypothetical protein TTHN1_01574 [Thermus thermophilus]